MESMALEITQLPLDLSLIYLGKTIIRGQEPGLRNVDCRQVIQFLHLRISSLFQLFS